MANKEEIFQEDDQAPLIEILKKRFPGFFIEKNDGKSHISYSFEIIDFGYKKKDKENGE